jgi:GNAT superfamily N-acetyltransferase
MSFAFCTATEAHAQEIAALVNRAYRPGAGVHGWTHEAGLVDGERTSAAQVLALFDTQSAILLMRTAAAIVACVHVQGGAGGAHIGMLATDPALQAQGLGKRMLAYAEAYAVTRFAPASLRMSVLSGRPELLAFYERRGYALTGETGDYPVAAQVGQPRVAGIAVLTLEKAAVGAPCCTLHTIA